MQQLTAYFLILVTVAAIVELLHIINRPKRRRVRRVPPPLPSEQQEAYPQPALHQRVLAEVD